MMLFPLAAIPDGLREVFSSLIGIIICGLSLIPLACMMGAGVSFRFRRVRFPLAWTFGVAGSVAALALFFVFMEREGWTLKDQIALPATNAVLLLLYFALPVVHRLSGFHPAEAEIALPSWRADQRNRELVLTELRVRMEALGLKIVNPKRWGYDLAAQGMVKGTVQANKRIPYMVFASVRDERGKLVVSLRADNMDIVISDTGESKNCEVLLAAVAQRMEEPPFAGNSELGEDITD